MSLKCKDNPCFVLDEWTKINVSTPEKLPPCINYERSTNNGTNSKEIRTATPKSAGKEVRFCPQEEHVDDLLRPCSASASTSDSSSVTALFKADHTLNDDSSVSHHHPAGEEERREKEKRKKEERRVAQTVEDNDVEVFDRGFCCQGYPRIALHSLMNSSLEIVGVVMHCGDKNTLIKQSHPFDIPQLQFLNDVMQSCQSAQQAHSSLAATGFNWDFTKQCYLFRPKSWIISSVIISSLCYLGTNLICLPIFHRKASNRFPITATFSKPDDWNVFLRKLNSITPARRTNQRSVLSNEEIYRKTIYESLDAS